MFSNIFILTTGAVRKLGGILGFNNHGVTACSTYVAMTT